MQTIGHILVSKGVISEDQLKEVLKEKTGFLKHALIKMGLTTEEDFLEIIAEQYGATFLNLKETPIDPEAVKVVPAKFAWHYQIMPVNLVGRTLVVATADPEATNLLEDLETNLGYLVEEHFATTADIREAIRRHYGVAADTVERILDRDKPDAEGGIESSLEKVEDLERMSEDASVIRLVNQILLQAITDRATDVHIELYRDEVALRYRIDGILYSAEIPENIKYLHAAIVSRIKVMSGLDIIEKRLPQDGRSKVRIGDKDYDLRVSTIPTLYGESVVIRILPLTMLFSISDLGMAPQDMAITEKLLTKPYGLFFVTGPTGCGKSTTLYSWLTKLNTPEHKIVTIEDPVEYELKGVSQAQVNPRIDMTFARLLRSVLRHDPNVMMIGEVRDFETAEIAIQAALTGHLVFSTLHTNDAASGITRLLDIGVEPFLVISSVSAFIAQRLVRVICSHCKSPLIITPEQAATIQSSPVQGGATFWKGKGCSACRKTGYLGRTGLFEILVMNGNIGELIAEKTSSAIIKTAAIEQGMHTLREDGWEKAQAGITTIEEVLRVTQADQGHENAIEA
ncbi:GspE/PulE family protein, partial [Verrucomicrobiota bacterium]